MKLLEGNRQKSSGPRAKQQFLSFDIKSTTKERDADTHDNVGDP